MSSNTYVPRGVEFGQKKREENRKLISIGGIFKFLGLGLLLAFLIVPLIYNFTMAFKPLSEMIKYPPPIFVKNPTLQNFVDMFIVYANTEVPLLRYVFNSVWTTAVGMIGTVFVSILCGYALAKLKVKSATTIFNIIIASMMISLATAAIMSYKITMWLGLYNSYMAFIIPYIANSSYVFLSRQFAEGIPDDLLEAARIDGASEFKTFIVIAVPILRPAIATIGLYSFNSLWGSAGPSSMYIVDEAKKNLPYALSNAIAGGLARQGAQAAMSLIMLLPSLIALIITQSKVVDTMAHAGIKG